MRRVSKTQIQNARKIGVLDYFQICMPHELIKVSAHDFRTKTHSSLVISDNGLFHWYRAGVGGNNAIDYLLKVEKMDFVSAVRLLNEITPTHSSLQPVSHQSTAPSPAKPFVPPARDRTSETIQAYLYCRGISGKVFRFCRNAGTVYQTTRGGYKNCVFLGLDSQGTPRSAFTRSCQGTWRGDIAGSQKKYGFLIPAEAEDCSTVAIFEAPIDAMSGASLTQYQQQKPWRSQFYLAMGGLNHQSVDYFLENHPQIKNVHLCLDNDTPGRDFSKRLLESLSARGYTVTDCPPIIGKDYNEQLIYADITEDDQQMMLCMLSVAYFADSLENLALATDALKTTAVNYNCRFTDLFFQQEDAFNTAMPYGLRRLENVHTMVTKNVTAMVPFNTQEVLVPGGIYYGVNDMSSNLIVGLRTELMNGNAMILATSGSGKSMFTKQEIMELFLRFPKARFYIVDPENEYRPLVSELGGIVVDISVESRTYLNPLEYKPEPGSDTLPNEAKIEFILSLCEQIMGKGNGHIGDKTIIDNSLRNVYAPYVKSNYNGDCPTLHNLWHDLKAQPLERAQEIALALEVYVNGSLSMFAKPTNVDMSNRMICFNIQSLGGQLKAVAMLYMLEFINTRVMNTERSSSACATWVYFDEIYLLLQNELSANFLFTSWKRFRKYNAFATGITQNVEVRPDRALCKAV